VNFRIPWVRKISPTERRMRIVAVAACVEVIRWRIFIDKALLD
jgi:hypothetical protein